MMKLKFTAENPHGQEIIECPECGFNNCKSASKGSPECCWCHGLFLGYNINEPCCYSNWKEDHGIWRYVGKKPIRIRVHFQLARKKLTEFIG